MHYNLCYGGRRRRQRRPDARSNVEAQPEARLSALTEKRAGFSQRATRGRRPPDRTEPVRAYLDRANEPSRTDRAARCRGPGRPSAEKCSCARVAAYVPPPAAAGGRPREADSTVLAAHPPPTAERSAPPEDGGDLYERAKGSDAAGRPLRTSSPMDGGRGAEGGAVLHARELQPSALGGRSASSPEMIASCRRAASRRAAGGAPTAARSSKSAEPTRSKSRFPTSPATQGPRAGGHPAAQGRSARTRPRGPTRPAGVRGDARRSPRRRCSKRAPCPTPDGRRTPRRRSAPARTPAPPLAAEAPGAGARVMSDSATQAPGLRTGARRRGGRRVLAQKMARGRHARLCEDGRRGATWSDAPSGSAFAPAPAGGVQGRHGTQQPQRSRVHFDDGVRTSVWRFPAARPRRRGAASGRATPAGRRRGSRRSLPAALCLPSISAAAARRPPARWDRAGGLARGGPSSAARRRRDVNAARRAARRAACTNHPSGRAAAHLGQRARACRIAQPLLAVLRANRTAAPA